MKICTILAVLMVLALSACSKSIPLKPMSLYSKTLESVKNDYPFPRWQQSGLEQYTPKACTAFQAVFDNLISKLGALGSDASEQKKIALFKEAIEATNVLNEEDESLIETG